MKQEAPCKAGGSSHQTEKSTPSGGENLGKRKFGLAELIGPIAFYVGLLIALITAFAEPSEWLFIGLGILGVIVGLLNITARKTGPFLLASIAFIVAVSGMQFLIDKVKVTLMAELTRLATNLTTLVGAAAMVVALRAIYEAAKST